MPVATCAVTVMVKEVTMLEHESHHMWVSIAGIAVMVAALTLALGGGWLALPLLGCAVVTTMMIWRGLRSGPPEAHGK